MDRSRTNSAVLVVLERSGRVPLHRQIATSIRDWTRRAAVAWVVAAALPCPRCRSCVSRGVVVEAYQQLAAAGYLASQGGGYTGGGWSGPMGDRAAPGLRPAAPNPPQLRPR